jgi:hypothetical protein
MATPQPEEPTVTVISTLDVPSTDPARLGKMDMMITYRSDPLHSFTIRIPAEGITLAKVDAAIRSDYATRKQYINRQVKV